MNLNIVVIINLVRHALKRLVSIFIIYILMLLGKPLHVRLQHIRMDRKVIVKTVEEGKQGHLQMAYDAIKFQIYKF